MQKNNIIIILIITIVLITITGIAYRDKIHDKKQSSFDDGTIIEETLEEKIDKLMNNMSIEQKIAQMLIIYYTNDYLSEDLKTTLKETPPAGFIINQSNITTYYNTKKLITDMQTNSSIPLIISMDQEGGKVQRLQKLTDIKPLYIPSMYDLGKTNDYNLAYNVGKIMAEQLRTIGVNVVYAPVLDVVSNPNNRVIGTRSFGSDPYKVATMAVNLAKGLEENGIIATYKHFPGHGDTTTDSHLSLPKIDKSYEELTKEELIPFKKAIENGAKIIMIGHLNLNKITNNDIPSSLSKEIVTNLLKNDLNYQGLVITDALNMKALTNNYSYEEIYTMAINAGVDLLLMPDNQELAIKYIKDNISENRIDESVKKILLFKYTYLTNYEYLDQNYLNNEHQQTIINQIPIE